MTQENSTRAALAGLRQAVAAQPESAAAHVRLGTSLAKAGALGEAEAELRRAIELEPGMAEALVNLGGVMLSRWDFRGCVEVNRQAAAKQPAMALAHYNQGLGHLYLGEAPEMTACFRRVVELEPRNPGGRYYLAVGLNALGEDEEARKHLAIAMELGFKPQPELLRALEKKAEAAVPAMEIG
jgi:Flp pilus assembly protein TadD